MRAFSKVLLACAVFSVVLAGNAWAADAPRFGARLPQLAKGGTSVVFVTDDDIPGIAVASSPIAGTLDENTDIDDVYNVQLTAGDKLLLTLTGDAGTDYGVWLYPPTATSLEVDSPVGMTMYPATGEYPKIMTYVVPVSGTYYLDVNASGGGIGAYSVAFSTTVAEADDEIPGVVPSASPIEGTLDQATDDHDVFKFHLALGERLAVTMSSTEPNEYYGILYDASAGTVRYGLPPVAVTVGGAYPTAFEYEAAADGDFYLDAWAASGTGAYTMTYVKKPRSPLMPVYRFYNKLNGSHFYTASLAEANSVIATLSRIYSLDGTAYVVNISNPANGAPLYRFYNKLNGSHFYTADEAEKNRILAKMSKTYSYDGPAYNVCTSAVPGATAVYRLYNKKNRSHFYTADEAEKNRVLSKMSKTYKLDGVAFYLAP